MRNSLYLLTFSIVLLVFVMQFHVDAAPPAGPLIKHLSSFLKWTKAASKSTLSDVHALQFESGYLVETVVEGNALGVVPYAIRVSQDGELFAVDADNSNIVRITPPLSQYSRARLVAGSFQGKTGHVDGKPSDARFSHPKGVTMDDKGNVYVADTENLAIRKIGEGGVTTIAGGKSNTPGYRDGPSEDAKFSPDFDVLYVRPTCSLLVVDRGNAALRQISLSQEDCDTQYTSVSTSDILMVIGAVVIGYASCIIQQGLGSSFFSRIPQHPASDSREQPSKDKQTPMMEREREETLTGWPSIKQLIADLLKLGLEASGNILASLVPSHLRRWGSRKALDPIKDSLRMPEDEANPQLAQKQRAPAPVAESRFAYPPETKPPKIKSTSSKDPSLSSRHRSSKPHEYAEFYGSTEMNPHNGQVRSKSHKERSRHRHRDKTGEMVYGATRPEQKPPAEMRQVNYGDPKFNPYGIRSRYGSDDPYRF